MTSSFSRRRPFAAAAAAASAPRAFTRAPKNLLAYQWVTKEEVDGAGQSVGTFGYNECRVQANVINVKPGSRPDAAGNEYLGVNLQVKPGQTAYFQTADPILQAELMKLNVHDLVYLTGKTQKRGNGNGSYGVLETIVLLEAAPLPIADEPTADSINEAEPEAGFMASEEVHATIA